MLLDQKVTKLRRNYDMDLRSKRIALVTRALTDGYDGSESARMAYVRDIGSMPTNVLELLVSDAMAIADSLAALIHSAISDHPPCVFLHLMESPVFLLVVSLLHLGPTPALIRAASNLVLLFPTLVQRVMSRDPKLIDAVIGCLSNHETSHPAMKFIRRLVRSSLWTRTAVVALGCFDALAELLTVDDITPYVAATVASFAVRDPVFGPSGYASCGGSLPRRQCIMDDFRGVPSVCLKVSHYLRLGNIIRVVKSVWKLLGLCLVSTNSLVVGHGLRALSYLSYYKAENLHQVMRSTALLRITSRPRSAPTFSPYSRALYTTLLIRTRPSSTNSASTGLR
jgi:hypothetical protein